MLTITGHRYSACITTITKKALIFCFLCSKNSIVIRIKLRYIDWIIYSFNSATTAQHIICRNGEYHQFGFFIDFQLCTLLSYFTVLVITSLATPSEL